MRKSWNKNNIIACDGRGPTGNLFPGQCATCQLFVGNKEHGNKDGYCTFNFNYSMITLSQHRCGWYEKERRNGVD